MKKNKFRGFNNVVAWIDLESGGLSKKECPILSFAIIITKNMKEVARKEFRFKPANNEIIQQQALDINGFKIDQIKGNRQGNWPGFFYHRSPNRPVKPQTPANQTTAEYKSDKKINQAASYY